MIKRPSCERRPFFFPEVSLALKRVISGGQTGVDRAGLDAAMAVGLPVNGCCPKGRRAEDGRIPDIYPLRELNQEQYHFRTELNVVDSDGTLIINKGAMTQGTRKTYECVVKHDRPCLVVRLEKPLAVEQVVGWIEENQITTLNIAGPRESKFPEGIYREALEYLEDLFRTYLGRVRLRG